MTQEEYCQGCYFAAAGGCNVTPTEEEMEEGCEDRVETKNIDPKVFE